MTAVVDQAKQAAAGATENPSGTVAKAGDDAKTGLGNRKGKSAVPTDGDDEDGDPPGDAKEDREKPSSLKIHIKLNLDVEVHLTARVKGDVTIGLL